MKQFLRETSEFFSEYMPQTTRRFVFAIVLVYLAAAFLNLVSPTLAQRLFVLVPEQAALQGNLWQLVTYMLSHAGMFHLLSNVLILFFFGGLVEQQMGGRRFMWYLLTAGFVAGLAHVAIAFAVGKPDIGLVGFSGAGFAIITAAVIWFPRMRVLVMFLFPVPLRVLAVIFGLLMLADMIEEVRLLGWVGGGVSHIAHLSGILVGIILIRNPGILNRMEDIHIPYLMRRRPRVISRRSTSMGHPGRHSDPDDLYNDPHWKMDQ